MTAHQRIVEAMRDTRKRLYVCTALYVGVGFLVGIPAAINGDRLGAVLGFLFISGALCVALLFHGMSRLAVRVSAIGDSVEDVRTRLDRLSRTMEAVRQPSSHASSPGQPQTIDLAAFGPGDPSSLTAARLDRCDFPRLVTALNEEERTRAEREALSGEFASDAIPTEPESSSTSGEPSEYPADGPINRNLFRAWTTARREGDLLTCRRVFSTIVDTLEPEVVARFGSELDEMDERVSTDLRVEFSERFRERDFAGALAVGERILELLPNHPLAREFERIRSLLEKRCSDASRVLSASDNAR